MKDLLCIFKYIQKYHEDNFDVLYLVLEFLFFIKNKKQGNMLFMQKDKKQAIENFKTYLESLGLESVGFHIDLNYKKVLRSLQNFQIQAQVLSEFIQVVTMQKTILKLYEYATPIEINALVCGILDIKEGESVYNPCCGLGSWFLHLDKHFKNCTFYGVDINPKLIYIAKALALLLGFREYSLCAKDIFSEPFVPEVKFDKIFCHPPLSTHLNIKTPKESKLGPYNKTVSEIPFIDHSLMRFKKKAVFIARSSFLSKGVGERLYEYLLKNSLLESIIELPDNIFPYQTESYSIFVISNANKRCLFIDAKSFYLKEGKYNRLVNLEEILDLYASKQDTKYSNFIEYEKIKNLNDYTHKNKDHAQIPLEGFLECVYRGSRIASKSDSDLVSCYDFGIKDFNPYGFSENFLEPVLKANSKQLETLKIKSFDLLFSMRGVIPKIAIIGKKVENKIVLPNAGILVLRPKDPKTAKALYFYFLSRTGQEILKQFYLAHNERVGEREIKTLKLPKNFLILQESYNKDFERLCKCGEFITRYTNDIKKMLAF